MFVCVCVFCKTDGRSSADKIRSTSALLDMCLRSATAFLEPQAVGLQVRERSVSGLAFCIVVDMLRSASVFLDAFSGP